MSNKPKHITVTVTIEVTDLDTLQMILEDAVEGYEQTGEGIEAFTIHDTTNGVSIHSA